MSDHCTLCPADAPSAGLTLDPRLTGGVRLCWGHWQAVRDTEPGCAVDAVLAAWTDKGRCPPVHDWARDQVRRVMPLLADALDKWAGL